MKQPIALRLEVDLLKEMRRCASEENRTLTNFIETVLKARIAAGPRSLACPSAGELEAGEGRRRRRG
ncbi:hypothetical protein [Roseicella aerolata]|uniref:Toxin-antitoxin system HicB family antitoxin n=1 Tax=Roseicella aerolata TaxID=2883479 RepID=A0A9X1LDQ7_9PROT|nr:hypothetical protein [Roseicella aerolata]MCB4825580.1 hypothetical protein [Roseicella aerolata]